jgi:hypothetical protein
MQNEKDLPVTLSEVAEDLSAVRKTTEYPRTVPGKILA